VQYGLVNLNTAPPEVLSALLPDNPAAVDDIVAYRQQHGRFQSVGELLNPSLADAGTTSAVGQSRLCQERDFSACGRLASSAIGASCT
jgi:type II secretory pathway component PulK